MSGSPTVARRLLLGSRGDVVCLTGDGSVDRGPCLTVALSEKWYGLCLVRSSTEDGLPMLEVEELDFGVFDEIRVPPPGPSFCDHVPNPSFVERLAQEKGWRIDSLGWDLIVGRWHSEVVGMKAGSS